MIENSISQLLCVVFYRIQSMVFTGDKVGAMTLYLKYVKPEIATDQLLDTIIGTTSGRQGPVPDWANNTQYAH